MSTRQKVYTGVFVKVKAEEKNELIALSTLMEVFTPNQTVFDGFRYFIPQLAVDNKYLPNEDFYYFDFTQDFITDCTVAFKKENAQDLLLVGQEPELIFGLISYYN